MNADSGVELTSLKVDGGMVLMQFQAYVLGVAVIGPTVAETTALGASYGAGLATGSYLVTGPSADSPAAGVREGLLRVCRREGLQTAGGLASRSRNRPPTCGFRWWEPRGFEPRTCGSRV